jgi:hypothetical protein
VREVARAVGGYLAILVEMQELWLLTRVHGNDAARHAPRLNTGAPGRLQHDPVMAYWRRTGRAVARMELWRLNPLALTWNLVRGTRQTLAFLVAFRGERD